MANNDPQPVNETPPSKTATLPQTATAPPPLPQTATAPPPLPQTATAPPRPPQTATAPPRPPQTPRPTLTSVLLLIFFLLLGLAISLCAVFFKKYLSDFASVRCNPVMMPFAGFFGYNATDNFNFCLNNILKGSLASVFSPVFSLLGSFGATLEMVVNAALGLRKLFSNFLLTVNGFIANVRDRIQMLMTQVRMSFLKIKELMGKVYGTMYAVIWMGTSGLTAAGNLANNDLIKFMLEFCFAPDTVVRMEDGSLETMDSLQIGSRLSPLPSGHVPVVTSLFRFDGARTPMVRIGDVVVSASHFVEHEGRMIEASEHPHAIPLPSLPLLCCLNATGHRFLVGRGGLLAADYDEDESEEVVAATQAVATKALNGGGVYGDAIPYGLGLPEDVEVHLADGTWKRLGDVRLGDVVAHAGVVKGVVREACDAVVATPLGPLAAAQLVFAGDAWTRAGSLFSVAAPAAVLHQVITEHCSTLEIRKGDHLFHVRDYREVALPEMEAPYAARLAAEKK